MNYRQAKPLPVTFWVLRAITKIAQYDCRRLLLGKAYATSGKLAGATIEVYVLLRMSVLICLLFFGCKAYLIPNPLVKLLLSLIVGLFALCLLGEVLIKHARTQFLDRNLKMPVYSRPRTLGLLFANILEIGIIFAIFYQLLSCLERPAQFQFTLPCGKTGTFLQPFDALYFSVVTLTTLGYGDIIPVAWPARSIVMLEELCALWLIVTVIGMTIQGFGCLRENPAMAGDPSSEKKQREDYLDSLRKAEQQLSNTEAEHLRRLKRLARLAVVLAVLSVVVGWTLS